MLRHRKGREGIEVTDRWFVKFTMVVAMLALLGACEPEAKDGSSDGSKSNKTVSIGECVTSPDKDTALTASKDVDFKTQLKEQGKLTVGSDIAFPPFESVDPQTNKPVGFDIDLATEVAERLGLTPEFVNTGFDALFTQSLPQGQFDIAISAITVKKERQDSIDFTIPYFKADLSLAVKKDSDIDDIEKLKGQLIGAQAGTTGEDCAKVIKDKVGASDVRTFETALQAFDDLDAGRVAGVVNDHPATKEILSQRQGIKVAQVIDTKEVYAIAIGKQKPDLRIAINKALKEIFEDGTYADIYKKWFKVEPPFELPPADFPN